MASRDARPSVRARINPVLAQGQLEVGSLHRYAEIRLKSLSRELDVTHDDRRDGLSEHVKVLALNPLTVREPPLLLKAGGIRSAGLQLIVQELACSSPLSFDGRVSSSATMHHISRTPSRSEETSEKSFALKKVSPASFSSGEDRKCSKAKWRTGDTALENGETGKIRPASAEGFFKGQRAPVRMLISNNPASPPRALSKCESIGLDERKILGKVASPPASTMKARPMSASAKSQRQTDLEAKRGTCGAYVYGTWDRGGGSMVRPVSAPPSNQIQIIDKRRADRRHCTSMPCKPPELDFVVDRVIAGIDEEMAEVLTGKDADRSRDDIGATLGWNGHARLKKKRDFVTAKAYRDKSNNAKDGQKASRPQGESRQRDAGDLVINENTSKALNDSIAHASPSKLMGAAFEGKREPSQQQDYYHRVLEQFSSPSPLRVRVTVKKPLVVYPTPISLQQQVDRHKRPGSAPARRQTMPLDPDNGKYTVPWRWRVTTSLPVGHHLNVANSNGQVYAKTSQGD